MKQVISFAVVCLMASSAFGQQYYYVQPNCNNCRVTYSQPAYSNQVVYSTPQAVQYTQPVNYPQPVTYSQPTYPSVPVVTTSATTTTPVSTASYSTPTYQSASPVSYTTPTYQTTPVTYNAPTYNTGYSNYRPAYSNAAASYSTGSGIAQQKAQIAASRGMRGRHVGGGFGGGNYEGVGFSTSSPQSAIQSACYWGQRPVHQIGVARGQDGWYATVIYR